MVCQRNQVAEKLKVKGHHLNNGELWSMTHLDLCKDLAGDSSFDMEASLALQDVQDWRSQFQESTLIMFGNRGDVAHSVLLTLH